jgi:hypothetical protein
VTLELRVVYGLVFTWVRVPGGDWSVAGNVLWGDRLVAEVGIKWDGMGIFGECRAELYRRIELVLCFCA